MEVNKKIRLHKLITEMVKADDELDFTQAEVQRNIESIGVKVDGELVKDRLAWVYAVQDVEFDWPKRDHGDFTKIKILKEAQDYLLLFKPAGIVVQSGAGHISKHLSGWLRQNFADQLQFDEQEYPTAGLVHRLDKDTQGLILAARNHSAFKFFQDQFRSRSTVKKYLALVEGIFDKKVYLQTWQSRNHTNPIKQKLFWSEQEALKYDSQARNAVSAFTPKFACVEMGQSIVEVEIKTGRMHQIRVQSEALGYPLVNDPIYNSKNLTPSKKAQELRVEGGEKASVILDVKKFEEQKKIIFNGSGFGLLSNYLKIKTPNEEWLEFELINYNKL